jgi:hypothetical protein
VPPVPRDPLLIEVIAALGAGRIDLGPIHDDESFVDGYAERNGRVRINPAPALVDTALHELIHRLRPGFSERAVRAKTTRLMRQLSDPEIDALYGVILATAHVRKTPSSL